MTRQIAIARRMLAWLVFAVAAGNWPCAASAAEKAGAAAADAPKADEAARPRRQGKWIKIPLPIDNNSVLRVQRTIQRTMAAAHDERPVFVLEFLSPEGNADACRGTRFGDALNLADFLVSDELGGADTVAYIPRAIKGHAVLAAIACEQILMASGATIGEAGADEKSPNTREADYERIARARHTVPVAVALGMLDKTRLVLKVKTEAGVQFVGREQLPDIEKHHRILSKETIKQAGEPWQITGSFARDWGIVKLNADEPGDVVRQMELSPGADAGNPSGGESYRAKRIDLLGPITAVKIEDVMHSIGEERLKGTNFICLRIDSPGGAPLESHKLANYLADLPSDKIRTVAYIPAQALGDAALVALGCDEIVMHPGAVLGGPGAYPISQDAGERIQAMIGTDRDSLARRKLRSWSLWAAMFNRNLNVYRCQRLSDVEYFCDDELHSRQPKLDKGEKGPLWEKGDPVTSPGQLLSLNGETAQKYGVAAAVVENFAQFKQHYSLESDPELVEPGWVDALAHFLGNKSMQAVLIFLGALGIYIELHAPGTGIGAFLAILAFALFFWSGFLEGTSGWLEVTLFVTGCICLLTEIFVLPGFVVFGVGGGALIITSIVLASQTFFFPQNEYQMAQLRGSLLAMSVSMAGLIGSIWLLNHWLPRAPVLQHVFLAPPEGEEAEIISRREMLVDLDNLVGQAGVTTTPLSPSGKVRFGNHLVDVISTGDFIARDSRVEVVEVHGNRVVVRPAGGGTTQG